MLCRETAGVRAAFRKALYLFAFSRPFSRYADSRLWKFIREEIRLLHVLQNLSTNKAHYQRNAGQIDHIFPRAELRKKEFEEPEINHFGNFWILAASKNQNKSDTHPAKFFANVSDSEMRRAIIDRDMLDYRRFRTFLKDRSAKIIEVVGKRLDFSDVDFSEPT